MKLILATGIYPPEIGGPATYAVLMEEELRRRGWIVEVLPFRLVRHLPSGIRHLVYAWKLFRLTRGADIILAQDTISVGLPAHAVSFFRRIPLVVRVPGDFAWEQGVQRFGVKETIDEFQTNTYGFKIELLRWLQRRVVRHADQVIAPSVYFTELVKGWGVASDRAHTIYNGVSVPELISARFERPTLISAGRLVPWKGLEGLIELLPALPGVDLVIVGEGPDRGRLESVALNRGVEGRVRFLGALPRAELLAQIAGADLFVLGSTFESFSFQIVEAMMLGACVVAQAIGNLSEMIQSGQDGVLVDPNDREAMKAMIAALLANPEERARLGANAKISSQRFSVEVTGAALERLLQQAIDNRTTHS